MKTASQVFATDQRKRIAEAVQAAESRTSAEIVPVVATRSGRYDRAEDAFGVLLGLGLFCAAWLLFQGERDAGWQAGLVIEWWHALLLVPAGTAIGVSVASRVSALQMLFTPRSEVAAEVARAARGAFFDQRVHHTAAAGGLLIYLSLAEKRAVVLADATVTQALGQPALARLCEELTARLRTGPVPDALAQAINDAGALLATAMPRADGDLNELADTLILLDD